MIPGKAKSVIFIFCYGGPSHVDTFDYKPELYKYDGKTIAVKTKGRGGDKNEGRVVGPKWKFRQYGECGAYVSDLFPHVATCVDDMAFIKSMYAESPIHGSAMLMMNSGKLLGGPAMGSWVNYGLGTVNQNLPGFVVMLDSAGGPISGAKNWSSGYMPAIYQGTVLRGEGPPILDLANPEGRTGEVQRSILDRMKMWNTRHALLRSGNSELESRIESYELAYRMQSTAPEAVDLSGESKETKELYGCDEERTEEFGNKLLLARRLVERGVRFVEVSMTRTIGDRWDQHNDLRGGHEANARATDQPIAALIRDLRRRGLLESTLVVWSAEFGRTPFAQGSDGRDHNPFGFTVWMAGGGVRPGVVGATDEFGYRAVEKPYEVHDLHATMLHLMGVDHTRLTYRFGGRDHRLTDVHGKVIGEAVG